MSSQVHTVKIKIREKVYVRENNRYNVNRYKILMVAKISSKLKDGKILELK